MTGPGQRTSGNTLLVVVSAPSGAGKTTLCERLLRDFPELVLSISCTTRAPRGNEREGKEYHFLKREEFQRKIDAGLFAEWAEVHGNLYGTSLEVINASLKSGKSVLLDIDVQGADSLRKTYPDRTLTIFVSPPSLKELEARLRARGTDGEESIRRRLKNARSEMDRAASFDSVVINDDLDRAYAELKALVQARVRPGKTSGDHG